MMANKDFQKGFATGFASRGVVGEDYILPIGGDELGGVKNGGNVVINEDGTMTAPIPVNSTWTVKKETFTIEGGESGVTGGFNLTPQTPSISAFTEAYLWAKLSSTVTGTYRINWNSNRTQIVPSQQINTTPTTLMVHVVKIGDVLYAEKVNDKTVKSIESNHTDSTTLSLKLHWATVAANEVITSEGGIMYR